MATVNAIAGKDYQFAVDLFHKCLAMVRAYEEQANCEVHKGAMAFNVALAYLWANDFPAAMHYFEFAQQETRETKGDKGWGLYDSELFEADFWSGLDRYQRRYPLTLYADFWNTPFGAAEARQTWRGLSDHSKLLYIMVNAERVSYRRLTLQPNWRSESFSLSHWNLIADLSRLIETEFRHRGMAKEGLREGIKQIRHSSISGFADGVATMDAALRAGNPSDYNKHFQSYREAITGVGQVREKRIAAAAVFAGFTRNLVQHQVDTGSVIFNDPDAAIFTVDVLLSLCCLDRWAQS